jgi:hypothetical protein
MAYEQPRSRVAWSWSRPTLQRSTDAALERRPRDGSSSSDTSGSSTIRRLFSNTGFNHKSHRAHGDAARFAQGQQGTMSESTLPLAEVAVVRLEALALGEHNAVAEGSCAPGAGDLLGREKEANRPTRHDTRLADETQLVAWRSLPLPRFRDAGAAGPYTGPTGSAK